MGIAGEPLLILLLLLLVTTTGAAAERNTITHLKGFDGPLPFSLETGYVEVEETHGVELFYYFIPSERSPAEDPVLLWLSGGPGCSGINSLFFENGPLKVDVAGYAAAGGEAFPGLVYSEDTWTKVSSMIYVDAPAGSGFSYAREEEGLELTLTETARQLRVFLQRWMAQHPEFSSNSLYIGGGSYAGYTVTVTALEVANHLSLNLVGYIVGNARGEVNSDKASQLPFMHMMGLISDELYEAALSGCSKAQQDIREVTSDVNLMHILEHKCGMDPYRGHEPDALHAGMVHGLEDLMLPVLECRGNSYIVATIWGNDAEVWETLGIRDGSVSTWIICPNFLHRFHTDVRSTIPYHRNLTQRGYRALVYNGDHDLIVPFVGTQAWIRSLGYPVVAPWRPWYSHDEVAGFTTEYAYNLTFATVKGAGHMAAESRPKECLDMIRKWTSPAGRL